MLFNTLKRWKTVFLYVKTMKTYDSDIMRHQPFCVTQKTVAARAPRHWFPSRVQTHDARSVLARQTTVAMEPRNKRIVCTHNWLIHARRGGVPRTGRMALWPTRCLTYNQRAPIFGRPQSKRHAEHKKAHNTLAYRQQTSTPVEHHRPPAQMRPFPSWQARYARASVTPLVTQIAETRVPCWGSAPCNTSRCNREM